MPCMYIFFKFSLHTKHIKQKKTLIKSIYLPLEVHQLQVVPSIFENCPLFYEFDDVEIRTSEVVLYDSAE